MKNFFYRVNYGDCVLALAKRFSVPVATIISENGLKSEVEVGDILYITPEPSGALYTVNVGDDITALAQKFGQSEEEILSKNGVPYIFYGLTIKI